MRRFAPTVSAVAMAATLLAAQQPQPPIFRGGTNVVRVDLYATRDGATVDDLTAAEVEVLEDGVTQTIDAFERVVVRPPVSQELRAEPNTVRESVQLAADSRARVFVVFLDTYHTGFGNAASVRGALQQFIDRVVGQDDLIGLMTPEMAATDVVLGRRTTVISRLLDANNWGRRGRLTDNDPIEDMYQVCYLDDPTIAPEMKARRREMLSLDALDDLVTHLGGLREERKAVLAVSEGWLQYGPNQALARLLDRDKDRVPNPPGIIDRGTLRQSTGLNGGGNRDRCNADRLALANIDNRERLRQTSERANRVNVSFYPVGAQGLAVFDSDIGPEKPPPLAQDSANLRNRQSGLRMLAEMTDGVAIVNTNNVTPLLRRVVDDMSSYYLLTYASTNSKLDGGFRSINVRLSRPGVQTRFRRGYRALMAKEIPTTITGAGAVPATSASQAAVLAALNAMAFNPRAELRLRVSASMMRDTSGPGLTQATFWLVGSLDDATRRRPEWGKGGTADVAVRASDGRTALTTTVPIGADGGFAVQVADAGGLAPGTYTVRVRAKGAAGATIDETARATVAAEPLAIAQPVVWRRRPATGPAFFRSADPRASRTDRLRFEFATTIASDPTATLLDREGQSLAIPLQATTRDDSSGRWLVVELALSSLAPGDYAVEVRAGTAAHTAAFRIVP